MYPLTERCHGFFLACLTIQRIQWQQALQQQSGLDLSQGSLFFKSDTSEESGKQRSVSVTVGITVAAISS
jgi:hypothetical protein